MFLFQPPRRWRHRRSHDILLPPAKETRNDEQILLLPNNGARSNWQRNPTRRIRHALPRAPIDRTARPLEKRRSHRPPHRKRTRIYRLRSLAMVEGRWCAHASTDLETENSSSKLRGRILHLLGHLDTHLLPAHVFPRRRRRFRHPLRSQHDSLRHGQRSLLPPSRYLRLQEWVFHRSGYCRHGYRHSWCWTTCDVAGACTGGKVNRV